MIRQARNEDRAQVKELWTQAFGDDAAAVELYFRLRHRDEDMLVWAEQGRVDGMLSMLPLSLRAGDRTYPARYIYAVATAQAQRGRGIATALLRRAGDEIAARREAAAVLVPASDGLYDYYAKRGYQTAFAFRAADFDAASLPPCPRGGVLLPCTAEEYARIRDRAFGDQPLYARWDDQAIDYALRATCDAETGNAGAGRLVCKEAEGIAVWSRTGSEVLVRELGLVGFDVPSALAVLHRALGAAVYRVRLAPGMSSGEMTPFGMIRWFASPPALTAPGYLSLALD